MVACGEIKKIGLELDKELSTVSEKDYRIKNYYRKYQRKELGSTSSNIKENDK